MAKKLTIDGKEITARDDATIIQAAHEAGMTIPHYCYHPKLSIAGNCRMCLVELEGRPKLEISCNTPVADNMVVFTNSPKVVEGRRGVLEFLLINHPLDCPICDQAGECGLQDYYMQHGLYHSRFQEEKTHGRKVVHLGPDVVFDSERCILCTRCVRFCREVTQTNELGLFQRGDSAQIATFPGKQLDNPYAGNTVDICPVGALTSQDFRFKIRVWFLRETRSVCPGCARGCNINIHHHDGHVYRLKPRQNDEVNVTWMCDAGRFGYTSINVQRLLQPQLRQGDALQQTTWPTAIAQMVEAVQRHGGQAVGIVVAPQGTNEDSYLLARLASAVVQTTHVVLYPGMPGDEDTFLIRADKNPNTRGAQDMGLPAPATADQLTRLAQAIDQGAVKVLYAIGVDLVAAFGAETVARWATQLDCLIVQASNQLPGCEHAHVVFPSATYAERDGTFTNFQGRVQRINAAFAPRGEALPAWQIYTRLAQALGQAWSYAAAENVLQDIAEAVPAYAGLSYAKIGDLGWSFTHES
ncbi:MAG: 2Fe-2S iron-sulfur cluster binding domain-containing protein [Candidatus Tectomicrobia bacterium]|uniref:2Fe-2S iron-sulfur cluster binding domain-containing protein n=1 Tax=Tectimicrobiota bacterium TaxID=2528274 RepID=A0A937VWZ3_UNCTE|nr:2Fe-2S iron-sulfur cluster binding domain-containing protein [Candidatus Tectomicrobia bacterium]